jgi:hypothetical protein
VGQLRGLIQFDPIRPKRSGLSSPFTGHTSGSLQDADSTLKRPDILFADAYRLADQGCYLPWLRSTRLCEMPILDPQRSWQRIFHRRALTDFRKAKEKRTLVSSSAYHNSRTLLVYSGVEAPYPSFRPPKLSALRLNQSCKAPISSCGAAICLTTTTSDGKSSTVLVSSAETT